MSTHGQEAAREPTLIEACNEGDTGTVSILLSKPGVKVNAVDKNHMTALKTAVGGGYTELVMALLKHPNIDVSAGMNHNALLSCLATNVHVKSYLLYFEQPPAGWTPLFSWLAVRLLTDGFDAQLVRHCEQALVVREGFALESDFADVPVGEMDSAYLRSVGITGKGVQMRLTKLHRELHAQHAQQIPPPPPTNTLTPHLQQAKATNRTETYQGDDSASDNDFLVRNQASGNHKRKAETAGTGFKHAKSTDARSRSISSFRPWSNKGDPMSTTTTATTMAIPDSFLKALRNRDTKGVARKPNTASRAEPEDEYMFERKRGARAPAGGIITVNPRPSGWSFLKPSHRQESKRDDGEESDETLPLNEL